MISIIIDEGTLEDFKEKAKNMHSKKSSARFLALASIIEEQLG